MSGIDILELGFGLFLGYWIVARLLPGDQDKRNDRNPPA